MNLSQWQKRAERGTSGDMVHDILADWQREQDQSAPGADLLEAAKELADVVDDLYRDGYVPSADQTKRIRAAIAQTETARAGGK